MTPSARPEGHPVSSTKCAESDCTASVKNHYWGHVKADGWFFSKEGPAWCPEHLPDWVPAWRERQKAKR